jgi:hypothetical protein
MSGETAASAPQVQQQLQRVSKEHGRATKREMRQRTGLGLVHGGVRVRFGREVVVWLAVAVTDFTVVFARLALGGRELVAFVAAEGEVCIRARTLRRLLG